jgi:hypothetical protein
MNGDAIVRSVREFDGFVFAVAGEVAPIRQYDPVGNLRRAGE